MKLTEKQLEIRTYNAGGGVWFRKSDRSQIFVAVTFYPKTKLWVVEGKKRSQITVDELRRDYERLRLDSNS
ncbi:MAG TPA: hypothetical protein PLP33_14705 [Leptospiraceae bacterium]|nr:hypothetical protein [Leptospiraceae bacterium]